LPSSSSTTITIVIIVRWISEKLDGVRAYWDGKNFYSRQGNPFPVPSWFKEGLPDQPLDGELWCGRQKFRQALSIIKNSGSGKQWEYVCYLVFDAPERRHEVKKKRMNGEDERMNE
jgi:ATP-dependent DNA ligase